MRACTNAQYAARVGSLTLQRLDALELIATPGGPHIRMDLSNRRSCQRAREGISIHSQISSAPNHQDAVKHDVNLNF